MNIHRQLQLTQLIEEPAMIRRLFIASALILGSFAVTSKTFAADTENVPFGGSVVAACSFPGTPGNGTLGNPTATTLSSALADGGTKGTAQVSCTGSTGSLNITGVTQTAGPTLASPVYTATAAGGTIAATFTAGVAGAPQTVLPGTTIPLDVHMLVVNSSALTAGTYGFTVNLTVTP
ncbi:MULTISPECIES: hypothetical protein [Nostocaceae]|uniref:hypothetical protein n=1 Tax=Nostocaceae TaxID=1162 RepID=UPI001F554263|nr:MULTISPECIES: hypothetical protein [Nostocaceae]